MNAQQEASDDTLCLLYRAANRGELGRWCLSRELCLCIYYCASQLETTAKCITFMWQAGIETSGSITKCGRSGVASTALQLNPLSSFPFHCYQVFLRVRNLSMCAVWEWFIWYCAKSTHYVLRQEQFYLFLLWLLIIHLHLLWLCLTHVWWRWPEIMSKSERRFEGHYKRRGVGRSRKKISIVVTFDISFMKQFCPTTWQWFKGNLLDSLWIMQFLQRILENLFFKCFIWAH